MVGITLCGYPFGGQPHRVAPTRIKILHFPASVGKESRPEYSTCQ